MDKKLNELLGSTLSGFRYMDDYYLYFNSLSEAELALSQLHKILHDFELETNSEKTFIVELPESIEPIWVSEMRRHPIDNQNKTEQRNDLITYFSKLFEYSKIFTDDFVIKYGLRRISKTKIKSENWEIYEAFILQSILFAPNALVIATEILWAYSKLEYNLNKDRISLTINSLILRHSILNHSHEVSWALWLSKTLNIPIEENTFKAICELEDSVVALVALDLYQNHNTLIRGIFEFEKWKSIVTPDDYNNNLYSKNWLLFYEASIKGFFSNVSQTEYINNNQFFSTLKNNNITFYKNDNQVQDLLEYIDNDEADDEADDDTSSNSWMSY